MEILNEIELQTAKSIIKMGLGRAAESLSFFMKEKVTVEHVDVNEFGMESNQPNENNIEPNFHLLITEVVGELEGVCCLVFNEEEAIQLQNTALPPDITENPELFEMMKEPILLEVDNIISAAVIIEFANLFKRKIHGSVPQLQLVNQTGLETFIRNHLKNETYIINFKTVFMLPEKSFSPLFIWFMNQNFIDEIKHYTAETNTINN